MRWRISLKIKSKQKELGLEWYWMMQLECSLPQLYKYLRLEEAGITFTHFAEWVVFPHLIRPDLIDVLYLRTRNREQSTEYLTIKNEEFSITKEQKFYIDYTLELAYIKYFHALTSSERLHHVYDMKPETFEVFLSTLNDEGYADSLELSSIQYFYNKRAGGESNEEGD